MQVSSRTKLHTHTHTPWCFNRTSFALVFFHQLVAVLMISACIAWQALVLIHLDISE